MQSLPDNDRFYCADCKARFNSAALLLNHFSQHIYLLEKHGSQIQQNSVFSRKNTRLPNQDPKTESILEQVLRQSLLDASSCDSNAVDSSSSNSDCGASTTDNDACSSEHEKQIPIPVIEIGQRTSPLHPTPSDVLLAKFDLQQRLENCILKLVSKKDSTVESNTVSKLRKSPSPKHPSTKSNLDHEEFNPLKFCVVTMDEGEEQLELDTSKTELENVQSPKLSKMTSNRKQKSPRKIKHVDEKAVTSLECMDIEDNKELNLAKASKKKYPCNVCWKVFGWSTDLKRHVLTHTGERPFKCQQCTATFTRNFLLQKHEMKAHLDKTTIVNETPSSKSLPTNNSFTSDMKSEINPPKTAADVEHQLKRKKISPQIWNKKRMVCKAIPLGICTPKALNIS